MTFQKFASVHFFLFLFSFFALAGCTTEVEQSSSISAEETLAEKQVSEEETVPEMERKEIRMTSFTEIIDGEYFPQYSQKEIRVKKGDLVRIYVTVTSGTHDIKIDEFDVYAETPLNEEVYIEFVADTAGSFEYYCTKPGHRKNGHWGTLIVEE